MKKIRVKEVLQNPDVWTITKIMEGYNGKVRIDAKRKFYETGRQIFFSEWVTLNYANRCRNEAGLSDLKTNF